MIRSPLTNLVIEKLLEFGEGTLDAFFPKNYSYAAIWRPLLGLDKKRKKVTRHNLSSILYRLQQQGLVERKGQIRKSLWCVTERGMTHLAREKVKREEIQKDGVTRLVIFDVPERERNKRDMIRAELVECNFQQLQKSVWIGECPLPKTFVTLIDDLQLKSSVHIFSVREKGTIDQ